MDFIEVWSYVTVVVTLLMFMTGIPPCINMFRTKSTENVPYVMFLLYGVSGLGMLHYGLMLENAILIFLNAVGSFSQISYAFSYILVSSTKTRPLQYLTVAVLYEALLYGYMYQVLDDPVQQSNTLGFCSSVLTTVGMILPAFELIDNIRNKNADGMPLIMLLGGLVCSSCWLFYGVMLNDTNIYAPNIPGIIITLAKLYVVQLYGGGDKKKNQKKKKEQ